MSLNLRESVAMAELAAAAKSTAAYIPPRVDNPAVRTPLEERTIPLVLYFFTFVHLLIAFGDVHVPPQPPGLLKGTVYGG